MCFPHAFRVGKIIVYDVHPDQGKANKREYKFSFWEGSCTFECEYEYEYDAKFYDGWVFNVYIELLDIFGLYVGKYWIAPTKIE